MSTGNSPSEPPILRLPAELTSSLMRLVLGNRHGLFGKIQRQRFLVLRQVCRAWRAVAYSTPDLWRRLDIEIEDPHGPFLSKLITWFARAGQEVPFHLALRCTSPSRTVSARTLIALINQFHFEYLHLGRTITQLLLTEDASTIPLAVQDTMKSVSVLLYDDSVLQPQHASFVSKLFQAYPRLDSLALDFHSGFLTETPFLQFPCQHLRSLLLHKAAVSVSQLMNALSSLPALEELIMQYIMFRPPSGPEICLPSLRRLLIHSKIPLLRLLLCPKIAFVDISGNADHPNVMQQHAQALATMINRSNVQYDKFMLSLGKDIFEKWTEAGTLRTLPLLQHLQITGVTTAVATASPTFGWPTSLRSMSFRKPPSMDTLVLWLGLLSPKLENHNYTFTIYIAGDPVDGDTSVHEIRCLLARWGMGLQLVPQETLDAMGYSDAAIINHQYRILNWH
ncbi:hypothetical protein BKA70DRAFT_1562373 [Coprinopsis sp. MPI-PUGE-AT-0042]|nr:hypothetical protein BKA70DRAFT_1562373 [Coprinopsis sp. MPI-PUGE-AT-0042]